MNGESVIGKIFKWFASPLDSETSAVDWMAGLVLILILSFMWSTVIKQID